MSYRLWILGAVAVAALAATALVGTVLVRKPAEVAFSPDRTIKASGAVDRLRLFLGRSPRDPVEHATFSNRVLVIRSLDVVRDSPDFADTSGTWSFKSLVTAALTRDCPHCPKTPDQWVREWVAHSTTGAFSRLDFLWFNLNPEKRTLENMPLRLLAVVNRFDLARVGDQNCQPVPLTSHPDEQNSQICGAEVRLVYAATGDKERPYLTLILEFVLPGQPKGAFQKLASEWTGLENSQNFIKDLETALTDSLGGTGLPRVAAARIRVNGTDTSDWFFAEAALTAKGGQAEPKDQLLDQQPNSKVTQCWTRDAANSPVAFVKDPKNDILHANYDLRGSGLETAGGIIRPNHPNVLTFATGLVADERRLAFSINSCTGCHGFETVDTTNIGYDSPFDQIKYRLPDKMSQLSNFLSGGGSEPSVDLWSVDWKKKGTAIVPKCIKPAPEPGKFNDLLRRHDFFDALAALPQSATYQEWIDKLEDTSLIAWQHH